MEVLPFLAGDGIDQCLPQVLRGDAKPGHGFLYRTRPNEGNGYCEIHFSPLFGEDGSIGIERSFAPWYRTLMVPLALAAVEWGALARSIRARLDGVDVQPR